MTTPSSFYRVEVNGRACGQVFRLSGRWRWERPNGGIESYGRRALLLDVRAHIARLNRTHVADVRLVRIGVLL